MTVAQRVESGGGRLPLAHSVRRALTVSAPLALAVLVSVGAAVTATKSSKYFIYAVAAGFAALLAAIDARRALYFLILLLPFETIGPVGLISSKIAKLGIMLFLLIFEIARRAIRHDLRWKRSPFDGFILLYLASGAVSSLLSIDPVSSLQSIVQSALIFGMFSIIVNRVDSGKRVSWLIGAMLVMAGVVAVYGILQKIFGFGLFGSDYIRAKIMQFFYVMGRRLFSVMNNPNALGGYMGTMLPIALAYLGLGKMRARRRWALAALCVLMVLNIVWASSRGAMAGTAAALVVLALSLRRNRLAVILLGVLFALLLVVFIVANAQAIETQLRVSSSLDVTLAGRLDIWKTAIHVGLDHLPFGIGYYTWKTIYPHYGLNLWKPVDDAHNLLLNMFVEQGIPGVILFIWYIVAFLTTSIRLIRNTRSNPVWYPFAVGMLGAGLSRLAHETVEADTLLGVSSVVQVFWVLLALQVVVSRIVARERTTQSVEFNGG